MFRSIPVDCHVSRKTQCYNWTATYPLVYWQTSLQKDCADRASSLLSDDWAVGDSAHKKMNPTVNALNFLFFTYTELFFFLIILQKYFHFILLNSFLFAVFNLTNILLKLHAIKKNQDYHLIAHLHVKTASFPWSFEVIVLHRLSYRIFLFILKFPSG